MSKKHVLRVGPSGQLTLSTSRRDFMSGALAFGLSPKPATKKDLRPNVLYVLCDEWRAQATGDAGDPNVRTRTLDRFAQASVNLSQTISSLPVCCPHRASLMTGQYSLTNGVFINDVPLVPKGVTLGEAFQRVGYSTGYIGKWHLYGSPDGHYGRRLSYVPQRSGLASSTGRPANARTITTTLCITKTTIGLLNTGPATTLLPRQRMRADLSKGINAPANHSF